MKFLLSVFAIIALSACSYSNSSLKDDWKKGSSFAIVYDKIMTIEGSTGSLAAIVYDALPASKIIEVPGDRKVKCDQTGNKFTCVFLNVAKSSAPDLVQFGMHIGENSSIYQLYDALNKSPATGNRVTAVNAWDGSSFVISTPEESITCGKLNKLPPCPAKDGGGKQKKGQKGTNCMDPALLAAEPNQYYCTYQGPAANNLIPVTTTN